MHEDRLARPNQPPLHGPVQLGTTYERLTNRAGGAGGAGGDGAGPAATTGGAGGKGFSKTAKIALAVGVVVVVGLAVGLGIHYGKDSSSTPTPGPTTPAPPTPAPTSAPTLAPTPVPPTPSPTPDPCTLHTTCSACVEDRVASQGFCDWFGVGDCKRAGDPGGVWARCGANAYPPKACTGPEADQQCPSGN